MQEQVAKDEERQKEKPKKDLVIVKKNGELLKVCDVFCRLVFHLNRDTTIEAQRKISTPFLERGKSSGVPQIVRSATAANLSINHLLTFSYFRKASASVLAVDERQSLEILTRDEKTDSRSLTQLKFEGQPQNF